MPKIASKPVDTYSPGLLSPLPLSNRAEHVGKAVKIVSGKYRGERGKIYNVITAEVREKNEKDKGRRGVYYSVELRNVIVSGLTWQDFIKEHTNGSHT